MCKSKTRDSLPTSLGQAGAQPSQESWAPSQVTVPWEDKHHHSRCLPFPSPPPSFVYWIDTIQSGMSLWPAVVSCPGCVSSQLLVPPSPVTGGVGEEQKRPWLCARPAQHSLKHPCVISAVQHKSKTQPLPATGKKFNSTTAKTSTAIFSKYYF